MFPGSRSHLSIILNIYIYRSRYKGFLLNTITRFENKRNIKNE